MPAPVPYWAPSTWPGAKSLSLALYTSDGSLDNPNGVAFHAALPILFEAYNQTPILSTSTSGVQTALSTSTTTTGGMIILDSAGYFGMTQDQPGTGYYEFLAAVKGSSGDGATPGGWMLMSHLAAIVHKSTQTSVSADLLGTAMTPVSGTRQMPSATLDSTPFFLDLVSVGEATTWQPAVTVADSASATATTAVSADSSGETCRFCAIWAASSAALQGQAIFPAAGIWPWTSPITGTVNFNGTGAGAGGGSGASSSPGVEYGGGGAGGGESVQFGIPVTAGTNYNVTTGAGGAGGVAPGSNGVAGNPGAGGGLSQMVGDGGVTGTAHGGSAGAGATTSANGTGGAGGTGSSSGVHANGGHGATGKTAVYGGGGGSSAAGGVAGTTATSWPGADAPGNGGPGGDGGDVTISVVQRAGGTIAGADALTVTMPSQIQAGNAVLVCSYFQAPLPSGASEVTAALDDGTSFGSPVVTADMTSLSVPFQVGLLIAAGVPGGERRVTVKGHGLSDDVKVLIAEVFEIAGLGPSPTVDASNGHTQGGAHPDTIYTSSATTTDAPDLWIACTGAQLTGPFGIQDPNPAEKWIGQSPQYLKNGGIQGGMKTAYQTVTKAGFMQFAGTFSTGVSKGTLVAAFNTSLPTAGTSPVIGPGGGGGAGLGSANAGGAGADGEVVLTWSGASGSLYGTPPLPAPPAFWDTGTLIGTGSGGGGPAVLNFNRAVADTLNFLSNPPVFRTTTQAGQSIPTGALTTVTSATAALLDSYGGWNGATTYTVQRSGLYLFHGLAAFSHNSSGNRGAAVTVNGTSYWGPFTPGASVGTTNVAKTQILDLQAGDTVQFSCYQGSGGALTLATTDQSRWLLLWLGETGVPPVLWAPPDPTFRFTSGLDGTDNAAALQAHLANDLGFLCNRPYFTGYQTVAQSGLTASAFSAVTLDKVQGRIHSTDSGDNYAGWSSGTGAWVAPVPGWYLLCGEFFSTNAASTGPVVIAGVSVSSSGGATPANPVDYYQQLLATPSASLGGGAAVFGLVYLLTGESVTPMVNGNGYASSYGTLTGTGNGGTFGSHFEVCWISS